MGNGNGGLALVVEREGWAATVLRRWGVGEGRGLNGEGLVV